MIAPAKRANAANLRFQFAFNDTPKDALKTTRAPVFRADWLQWPQSVALFLPGGVSLLEPIAPARAGRRAAGGCVHKTGTFGRHARNCGASGNTVANSREKPLQSDSIWCPR
jgi:hypothetical protein